MINSSDEIGINDGWTQIDMNGTDDGMVYESADGNNYYVYGYSTKLAAGASTGKLFDKVQFITSVGEPTKVTVWFFKETVNASEDTGGDTSGESGTAGTEVDLAVAPPVLNNYELLTSVTLNKGDTLNATPKSDDITKTGTNSYYWVNNADSTQEITPGQVVTEDIIAIPEYSVVKLMPADGNETVMIERGNGAVETYCTTTIEGFNKYTSIAQKKKFAPVGVKSVTKAFDDTYGDYTFNSKDYSTWYVYGLTTNLSTTKIKSYLTVSGDGYFEVTRGKGTSNVGTGSVITVYDKEGTVVEKFYVVIFGDVDQNGRITSADSTTIDKETGNKTKWSKSGAAYKPYLVRAANIDGYNTSITSADASTLEKVTGNKLKLDQTTGRAS